MTATTPQRQPVPRVPAARSKPHMLEDELGSITDVLCVKYPMCSREEVHAVVGDAYRHLAATATVTAHLIPLTVNRARRVLESVQRSAAASCAGVN